MNALAGIHHNQLRWKRNTSVEFKYVQIEYFAWARTTASVSSGAGVRHGVMLGVDKRLTLKARAEPSQVKTRNYRR
jgi:phage anti-repressor protein